MSGFDKDIASLLDDVLQDKEPEVEAKPDTPEPPQPQSKSQEKRLAVQQGKPLSSDAPVTLDSLLTDDVIETPDTPTPVEASEGGASEEGDVTTVVSDEIQADLPAIDNTMFSEEVEEATVQLPTFTTDELMKEMDIRNFGTLVSLTNRRWHAKVKDRKAAKDAADASDADASSFEARKRLLVGADEKLKRVHQAIDAARTDHYRMTLPWSTVGINDHGKRAGSRLLPNTLFFDYAQTMGQHKAEMVESLEKFVAAYPTLIAISQQKLGKAFNQNEYPAPAAIEQHFTLEFDFEPIPVGGDYQGLQDAQVEKLAGALERKTKLRLENAMQDAWKRLYDDVERAATALSNPDAMFHYTLFEKLADHASMLKHLNVTGDAEIEKIRKRVKTELTKHDVKDVRKDDALRKRLGEHATAIFELMQEYANVGSTETN